MGREREVTNYVNTTMKAMKGASLCHPTDRVAIDSRPQELITRDQPVLVRR